MQAPRSTLWAPTRRSSARPCGAAVNITSGLKPSTTTGSMVRRTEMFLTPQRGSSSRVKHHTPEPTSLLPRRRRRLNTVLCVALRARVRGLLLHPGHSQSRRRQGLLLLQGEGGGGRAVGQEGLQPCGSGLQGLSVHRPSNSQMSKHSPLSHIYNFCLKRRGGRALDDCLDLQINNGI